MWFDAQTVAGPTTLNTAILNVPAVAWVYEDAELTCTANPILTDVSRVIWGRKWTDDGNIEFLYTFHATNAQQTGTHATVRGHVTGYWDANTRSTHHIRIERVTTNDAQRYFCTMHDHHTNTRTSWVQSLIVKPSSTPAYDHTISLKGKVFKECEEVEMSIPKDRVIKFTIARCSAKSHPKTKLHWVASPQTKGLFRDEHQRCTIEAETLYSKCTSTINLNLKYVKTPKTSINCFSEKSDTTKASEACFTIVVNKSDIKEGESSIKKILLYGFITILVVSAIVAVMVFVRKGYTDVCCPKPHEPTKTVGSDYGF
ncbi:hypothetical protein LSAT2_001859 [Lamellibrachia satsuma]|nr:hypothetical protein LSAT2_001859 [Lamellibrachia satsuma]